MDYGKESQGHRTLWSTLTQMTISQNLIDLAVSLSREGMLLKLVELYYPLAWHPIVMTHGSCMQQGPSALGPFLFALVLHKAAGANKEGSQRLYQAWYLDDGILASKKSAIRRSLTFVFRVAVKWWLGLDTSQGYQCAFCPAHSLEPLGHHALTGKFQVEAGAGLFPGHSQPRPANILVQNWNLGRPVALDISTVSPLNPSTLAEAGAMVGAVLEAKENDGMGPNPSSS
ncbi:hypothetical protein EMCRGX_G023044 [Ephydatia muelleri]